MSTRVDGRHARSARTRDAIVDTVLRAIRKQGTVPTSAEIATLAGVTQRTLFNNFEDVDALLEAAIARQVAHVIDLLPHPAPDGAASVRITRYVQELAALLDEIAAVRWIVVTQSNDALRAGLARVREATRQRLSALLAPELERCTGSARMDLLDAAEMITDPMSWRLLRRQRRLSRTAATRVMRKALLALATWSSRTPP